MKSLLLKLHSNQHFGAIELTQTFHVFNNKMRKSMHNTTDKWRLRHQYEPYNCHSNLIIIKDFSNSRSPIYINTTAIKHYLFNLKTGHSSFNLLVITFGHLLYQPDITPTHVA